MRGNNERAYIFVFDDAWEDFFSLLADEAGGPVVEQPALHPSWLPFALEVIEVAPYVPLESRSPFEHVEAEFLKLEQMGVRGECPETGASSRVGTAV